MQHTQAKVHSLKRCLSNSSAPCKGKVTRTVTECVPDKTMRSYLTCETKQCAANNPIAYCAAIFERTLLRTCVSICWAGRANDYSRQSIGCNFTRCVRTFGVCAGNFDVKEANKRGSLHNHILFHGGITPALLTYVAEYPKLVLEATEALDTQVIAALPLEFHRLRD